MENGRCYIIGAGEYYGEIFEPKKNDLVIAADGGYLYLKERKIRCDIVIGDFDSIAEKDTVLQDILNTSDNVIRLNPIKDETDMLSAVDIGINKGYNEFHIYGGTGGRTAHTIANIQMLNGLAKKRKKVYMYGKNEVFLVIHNEKIIFDKNHKGYVSVFSLSTSCSGVYEKNLKYILDNYTMNNDYAIGVSNEFIGKESEISVRDGSLLIIYEKQNSEIGF